VGCNGVEELLVLLGLDHKVRAFGRDSLHQCGAVTRSVDAHAHDRVGPDGAARARNPRLDQQRLIVAKAGVARSQL
jgi:hypothetical protein